MTSNLYALIININNKIILNYGFISVLFDGYNLDNIFYVQNFNVIYLLKIYTTTRRCIIISRYLF